MNHLVWIFSQECRQNRLHFLMLLIAGVVLGLALRLAIDLERRIEHLAVHVNWNATLAIIPKGLTLQDLHDEIQTGQSVSYLPEAIFDTTSDLSKGQFKMSAILVAHDEKGPVLMRRGDDLTWAWVSPQVQMRSWNAIEVEGTPEWGHKVISGFFATGAQAQMQSLKDLVDRRTVAQAIWIQKVQERDEKFQNELMGLLHQGAFVFAGLLIALWVSVAFWLWGRLSNTFSVLDDLGYPANLKAQLLLSFIILIFVVPATIAFFVPLI